MGEFNERNILKECKTATLYQKSVECYRNSEIELDYDRNFNIYDEEAPFIEVIVREKDKNFAVEFSIENNELKTKQCTCALFIKNKMCEHIGASLLTYIRKEFNYEKIRNKPSSNLSEQIKLQLMGNADNNLIWEPVNPMVLNLKITYIFISTTKSFIQIEIGRERFVSVKNMREFLKTVSLKDKKITLGRSATFNPMVDTFNEIDQKIIDFFVDIYDFETAQSSYNFIQEDENILIPEILLKKVFNLMKSVSFNAIIKGTEYTNVKLINENIPLDFNLIQNKELLDLTIKSAPLKLTENTGHYFYESKIYTPDPIQIKTYDIFNNLFDQNKTDTIKFNIEEAETLAAFIIPALKGISSNVCMDDTLEETFYEEPLRIKSFLDKQGEYIELELIFTYGEVSINSMDGTYSSIMEKYVVRDINEEGKAVSLINQYNFTKDKLKLKYILKDEEAIIEFITKGAIKFQEIGEVYYSESFKTITVHNATAFKSYIRLNDSDLLEFNFEIEGIDKKELKNILKALKEKKKYYKLKKGGFIPLDIPELKDISNLIEYLDIKDADLEKDKILISKYNAVYIDEKIKQNRLAAVIKRNKKFRELVTNIREPQEMDLEPDKKLNDIMRNYQKTGFKWFKTLASYGFGGILADEMGMGKTLQAIAFIHSEIHKSNLPCLVIAPTSLVYNWQDEVEKFAPEINTLVVSGTKVEREQQLKRIEECDLVITSYALIRRDIEFYKNMNFLYCFLDEAQNIKNPNSINATSVKELKAKSYFALTGTPMENSLMEVWSIFDFLMPGYLLSHSKFSKKYEIPIVRGTNPESLEELNNHIRPFILRRLKKDNIKELPPKIEHNILVEMTEEQKILYMTYLDKAKAEVDGEIQEKGFEKSKIKILSILTRLRQICLDPSVFLENYEGESGKLLALDDIIEEAVNEKHRILLFSQFTSVLKNIATRFDANNIKYCYLDGSTKAEDRVKLVKDFNEGRTEVFLISLKAGGTGLNLTGADTVIHFDPWWNPAVEEQATDRAHRIGQKKTVEVIRLIARGSIEEKIQKLQEKKKEMINAVINEGEVMLSKLTQEEIENLFK